MRRIHFLDELRGFAIFCMVFYHAFFTMSYFFHFKIAYQLFSFFTPAEPLFAGVFILISGVCSKLSHSNLKRGIKLFAIALAITFVTYLFNPKALIIFGILHMFSICMILFALSEKLLNKTSPTLGLVLTLVIFFITKPIQKGYIELINYSIYLPSELYKLNFLFPFGICNPEFYSADYFPLIPWLFLFLAGTFIGQLALIKNFPEFMYKSRFKFFSILGRNSLLIYIIHQPVIYIICWLISLV